MRRILRTPAVFMCLVLIPTASFAQASIAGMVRDASGGVLPGVTVEATSPALIEKARTVVTDAGGQYRIVDLRPGTYAVTFTLPGFSTFRREGIELAGSFTATVNAELRLGTIEESVTVTGESPLVDVQSASYQRVIDNEVAEAIPTARLHYSLAVLIPGVTLGSGLNTSGMGNQDVGGSTGDQVLKLQIHGGRAFEQRVLLNGLPVGRVDQPMGGVFTPNLSATEEVVVDTGGLSPDMAEGGIRMTIVPRDGGNTFAGVVFGSFGSEHLATSNLTDDLKARGLLQANSIKSNGEFNPGFGGPIQRDKLWFYVAGRYMFYDNYAAGMWVDSTKNDPNVWTFNPDLSRPASNHQNVQDAQVRLTWQASPKNKLAFSYLDGAQCKCPYALSATIVESLWVQWRLQQITSNWTAPLTNRLMLEAGLLGNLNERAGMGIPPDTNPLNIPLMEQSTGLVYKARAGLGGTGYNRNPTHKVYYRSGLTYITGAHAFKIGFSNGWGAKDEHAFVLNPQFPYSYRLNNGVPNRVNLFSQPYHSMWNLDADLVVYAQDKWTVDRLTLNGGLLYSYFKSHFPENQFVPTPLLPDRNFTIPKTPHLAWKDITPRIGAAYDLFGTGRTAVKASLNKYLYGEQLTAYFGDPVADVVASTFRAWNDGNGDFKPDCDLTNPGVNGECGAMANPNFGKSVLGRTFDPEVKFGWGKRPFNWEFSTGVQHQLLSGVSMEVSYFRRWYGNFVLGGGNAGSQLLGNGTAADNLAIGASDLDPYCITAPTNPGLPNGGGYEICGLFDLNPTKFGVPARDYVTFSGAYGNQIEHWNGVDVVVSARLPRNVLFQGGMSTGRTLSDACEVVREIPEVFVTATTTTPQQYCRVETPFLTQVKLLGTYTVPRVDVQVSATFQSLPGPELSSNFVVPSAVVARSLGRPLSGGAANATVNMIPPGTIYGDRLNQLDLRFSKPLRSGRTRTTLNIDLYNALNASPVTAYSTAYATFLQPQQILGSRFGKVSFQFTY